MSYKIACARKQGSAHAKTNTPCQDETYQIQRGEFAVAALADGAGSAALSHFGARESARTICELMANKFDEFYAANDGVVVKLEILNALLTALKKLANSMQKTLAEFASTLLCVAIKGEEFILLHLGDGVIGYEKSGEILVASHPENGEFSNTTVFVTSADASRAMVLKKGKLGDIGGFLMMSDGPEACLYDKRQRRLSTGLARAIKQASYLPLECTQRMLEHSLEQTIARSTSDDCSMVIMAKSARLASVSAQRFWLLAGSNKRRAQKLLAIYERSSSGASIEQIAKRIFLPPKYAKKHIAHLQKEGLLLQADGIFYAIPAE